MAFPVFDFSNIFAKPDYSGLRDMVKDYYAGQKSAVEGAFRPQGLQSEIAKRLADTEQAQAQSRLLGLQSDYYPQLTQAEIAERQAHAGKYGEEASGLRRTREITDAILSRYGIIGGGQGVGGVPSTPQLQQQASNNFGTRGQPVYGDEGVAPTQGQFDAQAQQQQQQQQQQIDPFAEAVIAKLLGIDPLKPFTNTDNEFIQPSLFGDPRVTSVGKTEKQRETEKALISANQKAMEKNTDELNKSLGLDYAWDAVGELLKNNRSDLQDLIGPVNARTPTVSSKKRKLEGELKSSLGRIVLDTAQDIKGAWNARDQALVDELKPVQTDYFDVFEGKYKASQLVQRALRQRRELYNEYLQDGYRESDAAKMAEQQTRLEDLKPIIEQEYGEKKYFQLPDGEIVSISIFDTETLNQARRDKRVKEVKE